MIKKHIAFPSTIALLTMSFVAPASAYHTMYGSYSTSAHNTYVPNTHGLTKPVFDAVTTALEQESRAYSQYNVMNRRFHSPVFSESAVQKKQHVEQLSALLRAYGHTVPTYSDSYYLASSVEEACKTAYNNEQNTATLYHDTLLPKVMAYSDVQNVLIVLHQAAMYDFSQRFKACTSYAQPSSVQKVQQILRTKSRVYGSGLTPTFNYNLPVIQTPTAKDTQEAVRAYNSGYGSYPTVYSSATKRYFGGYR